MHMIEFTKLCMGPLFSISKPFLGFQTASLGPVEFLEAHPSLTGHEDMCFQKSGWFSIEALDENSLPSVQFLTDVLCRHEKALYALCLIFPSRKRNKDSNAFILPQVVVKINALKNVKYLNIT